MRTTFLSAAFAAALAATAVSPARADAQVYLYPNYYGSLGGYGGYLYGGYPYYSYGYRWANPYSRTYSFGYSNPFGYRNFRFTRPGYAPNYSVFYGNPRRYGYNRYGLWNRR